MNYNNTHVSTLIHKLCSGRQGRSHMTALAVLGIADARLT